MTLRYLLVALCAAVLASCSSDTKKEDDKIEPVEVLYNHGRDKMDEGAYKESIAQFEKLEQQYPYSEWAVRAEIMAAYANYRAEKFDEAISGLERFAKMHPDHPSTPYAYYLIALCSYNQITDVGRDQKMTEKAMQALGEVVKRFPDSDYARDARIKMDLVTDHLAGKEMAIGRYYLGRQEYLAAINRFKTVIEKYQTTSHVPEALHRLVECYMKLGVVDEAKKYAAVLGANYPQSHWYKDSYALLGSGDEPDNDRSIGRRIRGVITPNF